MLAPPPSTADIAQRQLEDAEGPDVGGADRLLGGAHAPDQGRRLVLRHQLDDLAELVAGNAGDAFDLLRVPLGDLGADLVHAVDALADEFLVLPAVLEDMPQHAPDQRNVGAGADADEVGRVGGGAGEARIDDDERSAVMLLGAQHVLHRHRMRLGRVAADDHQRLGVLDVVVAVGHGAVAPCIGDAGDRGGMADAGLVVDRVGPPHGRELAVQVGSLVGELGGAQPEHAVRPGFLADLQQLVADLLDRLIPGDPLPLAVLQLDRILVAALALGQLADRSALGAVRALADRAVPARLLAGPDAVLDLGDDRAADRAVGADALAPGHLDIGIDRPGLGLLHGGERQGSQRRHAAGGKAGVAEEGPAVQRAGGIGGGGRQGGCEGGALGGSGASLYQHRTVLLLKAGSARRTV